MPRCGQMSRSAKTVPSAPRQNSSGSPNSVFATIRPRASAAPGSAKYHISRSGAALFTSMLAARVAVCAVAPQLHRRLPCAWLHAHPCVLRQAQDEGVRRAASAMAWMCHTLFFFILSLSKDARTALQPPIDRRLGASLAFHQGGNSMTGGDELIRMTARQVVALLERRQVSPLELIDAALARIDAVDRDVNALPIRCPERA